MLTLQTELDQINGFFQHVEKVIHEDSRNSEAFRFLDILSQAHKKTISQVEDLYKSLNIADAFPDIQGLPLEFVHVLLMARDLKMNIRERAIGTFFEWDKLDRASGGRDQALGNLPATLFLVSLTHIVSGTKLYQQTRKAISKRTPALLTAIRKFNKYCTELTKLYEPEWNFPLPAQLPEELNALKDDSSLLADVWVTKVSPTVPRWLEDAGVRSGIRAVLAKDRCSEERRRLSLEAENCCRWYGSELAATELAVRLPKSKFIGRLRCIELITRFYR